MLDFVGLGLGPKGISVRGVEAIKRADHVYAEFYTSLIPGFNVSELEEETDKRIEVLKRESVEQNPKEILEQAKDEKVVFLVAGDPMVATTHVDLRMRAEKEGIETDILHGASIETAAPGLAGLQSYKFGRTATLPLPEKPSETPYEVLEKNQEMGLHTLFLLDIEAEEERYLTADRAIGLLLDLEEKLKRGVFDSETLTVVVARAGGTDSLVDADKAGNLVDRDFGPPPHALIVPGSLHFLEIEALESFGRLPEDAMPAEEDE